jgi:phospholipid-binding lipoprotein MlaA|tara:strand:- start:1116 stop:1862 length:747 start_codon:yes stop_codon:yes gene_type:complete
MILNKVIILVTISFFVLSTSSRAEPEKECFEKVSRNIFKFNKGFDKAVLRPIAAGYNKLPNPIKKGTGNFTSNIGTLLTVPNHILQGNWRLAGESSASFLINSTVGVLGFGNPAAKLGLKNQQEDVGQTLGAYGFSAGCYFVLPILGPTTVRDSFGMVADTFMDPFAHVTIRDHQLLSISGSDIDYYSVKGASAVNFRADNMTNLDSLEKNSIDMYAAMKSLYLQNREKKIGNTFSSEDADDWADFNK